MKSRTLPRFWEAYDALPDTVKDSARKAFFLWRDTPFHPSLRFKCVNQEERIWSVRITLGYRALGILDGDTDSDVVLDRRTSGVRTPVLNVA